MTNAPNLFQLGVAAYMHWYDDNYKDDRGTPLNIIFKNRNLSREYEHHSQELIYVYKTSLEGLIKIGITGNIDDRKRRFYREKKEGIPDYYVEEALLLQCRSREESVLAEAYAFQEIKNPKSRFFAKDYGSPEVRFAEPKTAIEKIRYALKMIREHDAWEFGHRHLDAVRQCADFAERVAKQRIIFCESDGGPVCVSNKSNHLSLGCDWKQHEGKLYFPLDLDRLEMPVRRLEDLGWSGVGASYLRIISPDSLAKALSLKPHMVVNFEQFRPIANRRRELEELLAELSAV